jgi:hypothetical protein
LGVVTEVLRNEGSQWLPAITIVRSFNGSHNTACLASSNTQLGKRSRQPESAHHRM